MNDFDTHTKLHKNVEDLGKLIVAKGLKELPKLQKIAQSGHTEWLSYSSTPTLQKFWENSTSS